LNLTAKELAELTILRYKEMLENTFEQMAFSRELYDGSLEKHNAVHNMLKHCAIRKYDAISYVNELMLLDPSFERAIKEASNDWKELFAIWSYEI
jgi:hypothetical protein